MRRLFRDRFFPENEEILEQTEQLTNYLQPHLKHMCAMSRPVQDWILDNIVQPLRDRKLLSIPQVIKSLGNQFDVYGSSPRFLTDWR